MLGKVEAPVGKLELSPVEEGLVIGRFRGDGLDNCS